MSIRVTTLNVWALAAPLAKDVVARMDAIAAALPDLDADLLAFQEVWTRRAAARLVAGAAQAGYAVVSGDAAIGGGLLLLSRIPARWQGFTPFAVRGRPERIVEGDYWGHKGYARALLETDAGPVAVITTHLQARYHADDPDPNLGHRVAQVIELAAALRTAKSPLVLLGDLNLREGDLEYRLLLALAGVRDAGVDPGPRFNTSLASNPYNGAGHEPTERIDYVMLRDGPAVGLDAQTVRRVFDAPLEIAGRVKSYSDHAGVEATVAIGERPARDTAPPAPELLAQARQALAGSKHAAQRSRRRNRISAAGAALGAAGVLATTPRRGLDRRSVLARLARALALVALPASAAFALLAERHDPEEIAAFGRVAATLEELAASAEEPG